MMSGQLSQLNLSGKPFNTFSMARLKILQLRLTHHSPFHYHQGSYYKGKAYLMIMTRGRHERQMPPKIQMKIEENNVCKYN
jgi:hypothetical protein